MGVCWWGELRMKPMVRIRGKYVNQSQIQGYDPPTFRQRREPVLQPGRDLRIVDHYETIRETILRIKVNGQTETLIGREADEALEDLQS